MLIYVAGPIRPLKGRTVEENCLIAKKVALELWQMGHAVICPHTNTDLVAISEKEINERMWLDGDLKILARCDALVVVPDWEGSRGTEGEVAFARERGIPIYFYPEVPEVHVTEKKSPEQCAGFIDVIMKMYRVHLQKNADYSPANILGTGELGVVVRLWDKIARLMNLAGFRVKVESSEFDRPMQPKNESIDDAYLDMAVYGVIGMLVRMKKWGR